MSTTENFQKPMNCCLKLGKKQAQMSWGEKNAPQDLQLENLSHNIDYFQENA